VFTPSLSVWNGRERIDLEIVEIAVARPLHAAAPPPVLTATEAALLVELAASMVS
jgi:hypothetical protein